MGYYKDVKLVNKEIDKIMMDVLSGKKIISTNSLILELTNNYEVGEKIIEKRIQKWILENPQLKIIDNKIKNLDY